VLNKRGLMGKLLIYAIILIVVGGSLYSVYQKYFGEIKRLPKNSLSPQQADGVFSRIFSLRDQQSLISKLAQQAAGY